jgi:phenylacetate-CoA ligase
MLIIRGVNVFPSQIEELILKQPELAPHYLLEVTKEGPLDHLAVLVEMRPEFDALPQAKKDEARAQLAHNVKSYVGVTAEVRVVPISAIERSVGKAKRVIDKRR